MSHVIHMDKSCHPYEWVMSPIWMSRVTHMNGSCNPYAWVMSRIRMSHVNHMNASCHPYEWVKSHTWRVTITYRSISAVFTGIRPSPTCTYTHTHAHTHTQTHTHTHTHTHTNSHTHMSLYCGSPLKEHYKVYVFDSACVCKQQRLPTVLWWCIYTHMYIYI